MSVKARLTMTNRVAFKSVATISKAQQTAQYNGTAGTLAAKGRHDPCVLPRAVPIVETMAALTIMEYVAVFYASLSVHTDRLCHTALIWPRLHDPQPPQRYLTLAASFRQP